MGIFKSILLMKIPLLSGRQ